MSSPSSRLRWARRKRERRRSHSSPANRASASRGCSDELLRRAEAAGACGFGGECVELGDDELPYAPLVVALRQLVRAGNPVLDRLSTADRAGLARLVPELASARRRRGGRRRLAAAHAGSAAQPARAADRAEAPLVLWLDDAQWADRSTRAFLAYLAGSLPRGGRLLTVIAYRSEELGRRHPLRPLLAELGRGERVRRLELAPFGREELATQLRDILGEEPASPVVDRLFERSEGNALFTEELLAAGSDGRGSLPSTLRDALLLRVERLPAGARTALRVLAAASRASHRLLASASGLGEAELAEGLREAVSAQIVLVGRDDRYGFRHALFREVIYEDLLPGERAEIHLCLARALEERLAETSDPALVAAAVAHHFNAGGDQPEALRSAVAAARAAEGVQAPGTTAALLDRALALWPRVPEPEQRAGLDRVELLGLAARAHDLGADAPHAVSLYEAALAELDEDSEPQRIAGLLAGPPRPTGPWAWPTPPAPTSTAPSTCCRRASRPRSGPTCSSRRPASCCSRAATRRPSRRGSRRSARPRRSPRRPWRRCRAGSGSRASSTAKPSPATVQMREAVELARGGPPDQVCTVVVNYTDALHLSGRTEEALAIVDEALAEIARGDRSEIWLECDRSELLFYLGRWDEAEAALPDSWRRSTGMTLTG